MIVQIENEGTIERVFRNVGIGEVFQRQDRYYIKTNGPVGAGRTNSVNLSTGRSYRFDSQDVVIPKPNAKLVFE